MIFRKTPSSPHTYGESGGRRPLGLVAVLLLHALVLWLAIQPRIIPQKKAGQGKQESEMLWVKPLAQTRPPAKPVAKIQPKPVTPPRQSAHTKPLHITPPQVAEAPPPPKVQEQPAITTPPPDDMMAQIEANRRRRNAAQNRPAEQEAPPAEDENQRALDRAQANIANLQARAGSGGRDQHGGVFKLGRVSFHKAEYVFNGWNKNFKRQIPTQIEVELGSEKDIETAIVNSMIVLIRKERSAEFTWESHRLGRLVELNAKPEFTAELQAFLMKEFFPEHRVLARQ